MSRAGLLNRPPQVRVTASQERIDFPDSRILELEVFKAITCSSLTLQRRKQNQRDGQSHIVNE